jgi:hypothetical protein
MKAKKIYPDRSHEFDYCWHQKELTAEQLWHPGGRALIRNIGFQKRDPASILGRKVGRRGDVRTDPSIGVFVPGDPPDADLQHSGIHVLGKYLASDERLCYNAPWPESPLFIGFFLQLHYKLTRRFGPFFIILTGH